MQARSSRQSQSGPSRWQLIQLEAGPTQALPDQSRQRFPGHHREETRRIRGHLAISFPDQHAIPTSLIHENTKISNKANLIDPIAALRQARKGLQLPADLITTHSDYTISTNQRDSFLVM